MNPSQPLEGAWSPAKWVAIVAVIFVVQAAMIWALGERPRPIKPTRPFGASIALWSGSVAPAGSAEDPTLLALPAANGFSGDAWLNYSQQQHRLAEWAEAPGWLALSDHLQTPGASLSQFAAEQRPPPLRLADQGLPRNSAAEPLIPPVPLPDRSRLQLEDNVALDSSMTIPDLPSWQSNESVSNSIVRVAFDNAGKPFSCILVGTSGLKEADDYAIGYARSLRFRDPPGVQIGRDALRFGKLTFQWHTVPASTSLRSVTSLP